MAARFSTGESVASTRSIKQADKSAAVQKNSMKGMPGFLRTKTDASDGGLASSKPVGPRFNMGESLETTKRTVALRSQGAYIGSKAKPGAPHSGGSYANNGKFRGSSDKSYRATSTAPAARIASNKGEPEARGQTEKERGPMGKPTSGFKQATVKTKSLPPQGAGHAGRMESLKGRAKTSWER